MQAAKAGDCKSLCLDLGARVVTEQFVGSNPTPLTICGGHSLRQDTWLAWSSNVGSTPTHHTICVGHRQIHYTKIARRVRISPGVAARGY